MQARLQATSTGSAQLTEVRVVRYHCTTDFPAGSTTKTPQNGENPKLQWLVILNFVIENLHLLEAARTSFCRFSSLQPRARCPMSYALRGQCAQRCKVLCKPNIQWNHQQHRLERRIHVGKHRVRMPCAFIWQPPLVSRSSLWQHVLDQPTPDSQPQIHHLPSPAHKQPDALRNSSESP